MLLGLYRTKALRDSQNQKSLFSHSIISSALTKTAGGTASPSASPGSRGRRHPSAVIGHNGLLNSRLLRNVWNTAGGANSRS
jgi:hypothetical protein